jgi:hypothetical protein
MVPQIEGAQAGRRSQPSGRPEASTNHRGGLRRRKSKPRRRGRRPRPPGRMTAPQIEGEHVGAALAPDGKAGGVRDRVGVGFV